MAILGYSSLRGKDFTISHSFPPHVDVEKFTLSYNGQSKEIVLQTFVEATAAMKRYEYVEDKPGMVGGGPNGFYNVTWEEIQRVIMPTGLIPDTDKVQQLPVVEITSNKAKKTVKLLPVVLVAGVLLVLLLTLKKR